MRRREQTVRYYHSPSYHDQPRTMCLKMRLVFWPRPRCIGAFIFNFMSGLDLASTDPFTFQMDPSDAHSRITFKSINGDKASRLELLQFSMSIVGVHCGYKMALAELHMLSGRMVFGTSTCWWPARSFSH